MGKEKFQTETEVPLTRMGEPMSRPVRSKAEPECHTNVDCPPQKWGGRPPTGLDLSAQVPCALA